MRDGKDVEGQIDKMHEPSPDTDGRHVWKNTLHIDPQQAEEGNEEVTKDDNDANPEPSTFLPHDVPERLFGHVAIPNDKILRKVNVGVKYRECEQQRTQEIILMFVKNFGQHSLAIENHRNDVRRSER